MTAFPTGTRRSVLSRRRGLIALLGLTAAAVLGGQGSAAALSPAPSYTQEFADASVITDGGQYWTYGTGAGGELASHALFGPHGLEHPDRPAAHAAVVGHAGTHLGAVGGADRRKPAHVLHVRDTESGRQCISLATARTPAGPFTDASGGSFMCQLSLGGSIDPQVFTAADSVRYLDW